ncbi:MAG: HEAT repeat domain-containing protein [Vicinamibacterales bacterium]
MKNRYAYALVIWLAAAPAAAQPKGAEPVEPVPKGPGPMAPGLPGQGPLESLLAPLMLDDLGPGPLERLVAPSMPDALEPGSLKMLTSPLRDMPSLAHTTFLIDGMTFDFAQDRGRDREAELREREREREARLYSEGWEAAGDYRWDRALSYFNRVIELKGSKLDAALYWKAYSQNRLGQRAEALTTIADLTKNHPNSTYLKQAAVLAAEVRRDVGQPIRPQDSADDEVKLMALQALQHTAPEEAIPMIEKVLEGTSGPKVKQRALFVLAQSRSPRAREVLRNYAKGGATPELQSQAIQYLGVHGGPESRAVLAEVYGATTDVDVKRRILRAFMVAGEKDRLLKAAQGEQNPELRAEAVGQLGHMQAHEELWQLYQKESSVDVRRRILRAMQIGGSVDRLIEIAKAEQNSELRRDAIRALGLTRATRTGDVLMQIYGSDTNVDVRKSVINALFLQDNVTALVALARKEQDITMKKELVGRLSQMRSKVATDYLLELLGK